MLMASGGRSDRVTMNPNGTSESDGDSDSPAKAAERKRFHQQDAAGHAAAVGLKAEPLNRPTEKFAYFEDDTRFVVVAGAQEKDEVESAFARGLGLRGNRRLVLVLPERHSFATTQRAPWFKLDAQPEIWTYGKTAPVRQVLKTREQTRQALHERLKPGETFKSELQDATAAKHLGGRSNAVWELVEWATMHEQLDPGHRKGERAWHCMGQKVLSITGTRAGLKITAGVHYTGAGAPEPLLVEGTDALALDKVASVRTAVEVGITARLDGSPPIHRPDEHWLQAVIRRDPKLVGVEHPALREFPAWRPRDDDGRRWGRGFIDLMGIDGHGNIRIVETKLAENADELLIFQGLDYYIWAQAYVAEVRGRLSTPPRSRVEIHYVIGDDTKGNIHVTKYASAQANALIDEIPWRFQTVRHWYPKVGGPDRAQTELLAAGQVPV